MIYPKDFKRWALKLYPDNEELREALETGNDAVVNNILYTALELSIDYKTALQAKDILEIWKIAKDIQFKVELFQEWKKLNHV